MSTTTEAVWRNLPSVYRRAGSLTPAHGLAVALGRMLIDLERTAKDVLRAHHLEHANDLDDLKRLAAWFQLAPWPEEDREGFRTRIRRMAAVYREGAASAGRLLDVLAVTMGAEIATVDGKRMLFVPRYTQLEASALPAGAPLHAPWPEAGSVWASLVPSSPSPYAVYAILKVKVGDTVWGVPAALLDLPKHRLTISLTPDESLGRLEWKAAPPYESLDDDPDLDTYTNPIVTIWAPEDHAVSLPSLVQRDLRRAVLINRLIPAGGALQVDLNQFTLTDLVEGKPSQPVLNDQPALLFGTGGTLGENRLGPAPPPFRLLRWYTLSQLEPLFAAGDPADLIDPTADGKLPWPNLLTPLLPDREPVRWRLLLGNAKLGLVNPTKATTVAKIDFTMIGRRPGTFSLLYEDRWVLGTDEVKPLTHRAAWLQEQIDRLKLAGVIHLRPDQIEPSEWNLPAAKPLEEASRELVVSAAMTDAVVLERESFLHLTESLAMSDTPGSEADKLLGFQELQGLGDQPAALLEAHLDLTERILAEDSLLLQPMQRSLDEKLMIQDTVRVSVTRRR